MAKIELTILKEDILEDNYSNSNSCPITKALKRAGYEDWSDGGTGIDDDSIGTKIVSEGNASYDGLVDKLFGMYNSFSLHIHTGNKGTSEPIPVETFTHTIEY